MKEKRSECILIHCTELASTAVKHKKRNAPDVTTGRRQALSDRSNYDNDNENSRPVQTPASSRVLQTPPPSQGGKSAAEDNSDSSSDTCDASERERYAKRES